MLLRHCEVTSTCETKCLREIVTRQCAHCAMSKPEKEKGEKEKEVRDLPDPEWLIALKNGQFTNPELDLSKLYSNKRHVKKFEEDEGIPIQFIERLSLLALPENNTIEIIYLANCNIGDPGLRLLGRALQQNQVVRALDLRNNGLTSIAVRGFVSQLHSNWSLVECKMQEKGDIHSKQSTLYEGLCDRPVVSFSKCASLVHTCLFLVFLVKFKLFSPSFMNVLFMKVAFPRFFFLQLFSVYNRHNFFNSRSRRRRRRKI